MVLLCVLRSPITNNPSELIIKWKAAVLEANKLQLTGW